MVFESKKTNKNHLYYSITVTHGLLHVSRCSILLFCRGVFLIALFWHKRPYEYTKNTSCLLKYHIAYIACSSFLSISSWKPVKACTFSTLFQTSHFRRNFAKLDRIYLKPSRHPTLQFWAVLLSQQESDMEVIKTVGKKQTKNMANNFWDIFVITSDHAGSQKKMLNT